MKYKRIFAVIAASMIFLLSSCTNEENGLNRNYTVTYNSDYGYSTTIRVFECNEIGDKVNDVSANYSKGETKSFTAQQNTVKLKVYVKSESMFGNITGYVQRAYYLSSSPTSIVIDDNTVIGNSEP